MLKLPTIKISKKPKTTGAELVKKIKAIRITIEGFDSVKWVKKNR
jgi:hypothetical protein